MPPHLSKLLIAIAVAITALAAQVAQAAPDEPSVPTKIAVPEGNKLFLVGHAVGVQIYTCTASTAGLAWSSATPRADLYDDNGRVIIKHFGGPSWQAKDGSKVIGSRVDGVMVDDTAIPWLLLHADKTFSGADGDRLTGTTYIQRIATTGGLTPPAADCTTAGSVVEKPYTADYYFWKKEGGD
jgi:hypothetical protein